MWVGLLMYIYLASADGTFNVAKGGHKRMPGGSWSVHLLVSFEVTTCGGRGSKFTLKLCLSNLEQRSDPSRGSNILCKSISFGEELLKFRRSPKWKTEHGTYPRDVPQPFLEPLCLWPLSSLNRKKEMEIQKYNYFFFSLSLSWEAFLGSLPKSSSKVFATMDLTVAFWAALALWLDCARAGKDGTDNGVTDHSSFLW